VKLAPTFLRRKKNGLLLESQNDSDTFAKVLEKPLDATLFHITHWKAATHWIQLILKDAFPKHTLMPRSYFDSDLSVRVIPNRVYPAACMMKEAFDSLELPANTRRFVVIRDLRDVVVSAYFSIRYSHKAAPYVERDRRILESLDQDNAMLYLIRTWAFTSAAIQRSWLSAHEPFFKFEDITKNPTENFRKIFLEHWGLTIDTAVLDEVLARHHFSRYSGGRDKGNEDINSHYRKGTAGDWRLHFSAKTKAEFKRLFNDVLVLGGYERDDLW
jgi:Sulfotransferase domain